MSGLDETMLDETMPRYRFFCRKCGARWTATGINSYVAAVLYLRSAQTCPVGAHTSYPDLEQCTSIEEIIHKDVTNKPQTY